ncbi:hypothetical protein LOTGIDRAFT_164598 [Lottia gigantea]|uniref:Fibrinogen C-terminal domain-containing protein n=1 Tax=Lottia gigantea TaxID=225164 RepID=V3ZFI2_LOTGI|nr:hypothetical protein LOTGIDRAFT_164598 [Lottia gigantea]ESO89903.1 hypothetical protein LOTGIDRAFT_164598 [Lottia gigantea]
MYKDGTNCILPKSSLSNCVCFKKEIRCNGAGNCICPWGQYGLNCKEYIKDCKDGIDRGISSSSTILVAIKPSPTLEPFDTVCVMNNQGWTTILDRLSSSNRINFNRTLADYKEGFGDNQVMRWLGFIRIHQLLSVTANYFRLMVLIVSSNGSACYSYYNNFDIGPAPNYILSGNYLHGYSKCGDSLVGLIGKSFSTADRDVTGKGCSTLFGGGWWYDAANGCSDTKGVLTAMPEPFWKNDLNADIPKRISMKILRL